MKNLRYFAQKYIDWVIKLGRLKFSLLGITLLAILAVLTQILLSIFIIGEIHWGGFSPFYYFRFDFRAFRNLLFYVISGKIRIITY